MTLSSRLTGKSVTVLLVLGLALFVFVQGFLPVQADTPELPTECSDLIDNDGDGFIDFVPLLGDPDCEDIFDDSEEGVPPPVDVCGNEETDPGLQTEGPCNADDLCPNDEGIQTETPCASDDLCPNDEGIQTETPCVSEDVCPDDDGIQTETPCPSDENNDDETPPPDNDENNGGGDTGGSSSGSGSSGGGGGGGGPISGPLSFGYVNNGGGAVLGTSTEAAPSGTSAGSEAPACTPHLTTYLKMGSNNNVEEVKKLQTFLNTHVSSSLPVTGLFGPMTFEAVKNFQLTYAMEILAPWVPFGLASDKTATGYVYKTTLRMINKIMCASTEIPMPVLP